eukprot:GEMP01046511.1.p1 GENE.GEMP01046511.1~~GEMP01046511.1.p1  ORF type:complete len:225 (+),score=43.73 GEMP01046511.1:152-826(+)
MRRPTTFYVDCSAPHGFGFHPEMHCAKRCLGFEAECTRLKTFLKKKRVVSSLFFRHPTCSDIAYVHWRASGLWAKVCLEDGADKTDVQILTVRPPADPEFPDPPLEKKVPRLFQNALRLAGSGIKLLAKRVQESFGLDCGLYNCKLQSAGKGFNQNVCLVGGDGGLLDKMCVRMGDKGELYPESVMSSATKIADYKVFMLASPPLWAPPMPDRRRTAQTGATFL